jgi:hypothetical protein
MRLGIVAGIVVAVTVTATSAGAKDDGSKDGAQAFFRTINTRISNRQWGPLYKRLHPAQQELIDRAAFFECEDRETPEGTEILGVEFIDSYREPVMIPGTDTEAKATALTVKVTVRRGHNRRTLRDTTHVFFVKGKWRFIVDADRVDECTPGGSRSATTLPGPNNEVLVQVLNGSGVSGAAQTKSNELRSQGYATANATDAPALRNGSNAVQCAPGFEKDAERLAKAVGGTTVIEAFPDPAPEGTPQGVNCFVLLASDAG